MKIIDGDALIRRLEQKASMPVPGWIKETIEEMSTVLVTCEDCVHSSYDSLFHERWCRGREVDDEWFCADGKEGPQE